MEQVQEKKIDRTGWPKGEWDNEPDRLDFIHAGFSCLLHRNGVGAWCGYVGVPEGHPAFGKDYSAVDVDVHGGLTYSDPCRGAICHTPQPGMPEKVWWLGFDTAHLGDNPPGIMAMHIKYNLGGNHLDETYKNMSYAMDETERLAEQLSEQSVGISA